MFERFTERARQVVVLAQDEARGLRHDRIGTEHLLLGILRQEESLAAAVLASFGFALEETREEIARLVGRSDADSTGRIPFTPRAKKALELALREALALGHDDIAPEHVLLGIARENRGHAARVLNARGAAPVAIREAVQIAIGRSAPADRPPIAGARPSVTRWEHTLARVERVAEISEELLDALGVDGWELVGALPDAEGVLLVFKRPAHSVGRR